MDGLLLLQLFLLSQMRAAGLVRVAFHELGVNATDVAAARSEAESRGLTTPGHATWLYAGLLGRKGEEELLASDDEYRQVAHHYHLPLWPDLRLTVVGNAAWRTAGIWFTARPDTPRLGRLSADALAPWHMVEDQLAPTLQGGRVSDEWYPQKDYECILQAASNRTTAKFVLRFDFNLLQEVVLL